MSLVSNNVQLSKLCELKYDSVFNKREWLSINDTTAQYDQGTHPTWKPPMGPRNTQAAILLAPHTNGPKDLPWCGTLGLLKTSRTSQGGFSRNRWKRPFWDLRAWLCGSEALPSRTAEPTRINYRCASSFGAQYVETRKKHEKNTKPQIESNPI
jgi:hypothetical protein